MGSWAQGLAICSFPGKRLSLNNTSVRSKPPSASHSVPALPLLTGHPLGLQQESGNQEVSGKGGLRWASHHHQASFLHSLSLSAN